MKQSIFNGKVILAVDGNKDTHKNLDAEIKDKCDRYRLEAARTYKEAVLLMTCWTYDLIVLNADFDGIMKLLDEARWRRLPVVMLTSGSLIQEELREWLEKGARSYFPKDQRGELAPFLENVLMHEYQSMWKRFLKRLGSCFNGNEKPKRLKSEKKFWKEFYGKKKIDVPTIVRSHKFGRRVNDILLEIDGHKIDDFGEIFFKPLGQRIQFDEILHRKKRWVISSR